MNKNLTKLTTLLLSVSLLSFCFINQGVAQNGSSSIKIGNKTFKPSSKNIGMSNTPSVSCEVLNSDSQSKNLFITFVGGSKKKSAFLGLTINLNAEQIASLMTGSIIEFEHGNDISSLSNNSPVLLSFSTGRNKSSKKKEVSVTTGTPITPDSNYSIKGTLEVLNVREDGCLDVQINADAKNFHKSKFITKIDPKRDCIKDSNGKKLKTFPMTTISGTLFPEIFQATESTGGRGLCDAPDFSSTSSSSTSGSPPTGTTSSGGTTSGNSSGFPDDFELPDGIELPDGSEFPTN